jgi:hypothetical protein
MQFYRENSVICIQNFLPHCLSWVNCHLHLGEIVQTQPKDLAGL